MKILADDVMKRNQAQQAAGVILLDDYGKAAENRARDKEQQARDAVALIRQGRDYHSTDRRLILSPDEVTEYTYTAAHLEGHGNHLPKFNRDHTARLTHLERMYKAHGRLVFVTGFLWGLDDLPLRSEALAASARVQVPMLMSTLTTAPAAPYTVDIQRGIWDGTHAHIVTPLQFLNEAAEVAAEGRDGWYLDDGTAFAVVMGDTPKDRLKVARYCCRPAETKLTARDHPQFLQFLEDEMQRRANGESVRRLGWQVNIP